MSIIAKKICLIGDFCVGKTSLIRRFVDNQFSDDYLSTIGVKISRKLVEIRLNDTTTQKVQLIIWDIEGQTKFQSIAPSYLQGAKGGIIVADCTREETIEHLQDHINLFCSVNPKGSIIIIALNKSDLMEDQEKFNKLTTIKNLVNNNPSVITSYLTSAKTGLNVNEMFAKLVRSMI